MIILLAAGTSLACTFYVYVLVQFLRDDPRMLRQPRAGSEPGGGLRDCTSH
jgi:hypothetical protein